MRKRALCVFGLLGLRGLPMLVFGCERELDGQRGAGFMLTLGAKQIGGGSNREARIEVLVVPGTLELIPAVRGATTRRYFCFSRTSTLYLYALVNSSVPGKGGERSDRRRCVDYIMAVATAKNAVERTCHTAMLQRQDTR